jgi:hypothetical protein
MAAKKELHQHDEFESDLALVEVEETGKAKTQAKAKTSKAKSLKTIKFQKQRKLKFRLIQAAKIFRLKLRFKKILMQHNFI